jgi:SAM-dependent methyltransferase
MSIAATGPGMIDWGVGQYETTAADLEPVAEHVVSLAGVRPQERLLDLATGTGNAALAAARRGARVTGIDSAPRLIEIARRRAASERLDASFLVGDMHDLPFESEAFNCVLSVFGIIFTTDPAHAVAEMIRVLTPGGRAMITAWVPAGAIDAMVGVFMRAVAALEGQPPNRFAWHEPDPVENLLAPYPVNVRWHEGALAITARSPEDYLDAQERSHPMSVASRPLLERTGGYAAARQQALAVIRQGNECPESFKVTSPYRVIEIQRIV